MAAFHAYSWGQCAIECSQIICVQCAFVTRQCCRSCRGISRGAAADRGVLITNMLLLLLDAEF